jgi:hypothetical protein
LHHDDANGATSESKHFYVELLELKMREILPDAFGVSVCIDIEICRKPFLAASGVQFLLFRFN